MQVTEAALIDLAFDSCDQRNSNLHQVNFSRAWLINCNLNGAKMSQVNIGYKPALKGQTLPITSLAIASDKNILLVSEDNTIKIWEMETANDYSSFKLKRITGKLGLAIHGCFEEGVEMEEENKRLTLDLNVSLN